MKSGEKREAHEQFNIIYEKYRDSVYKFCLSKLNCDVDSAEDCTQETFIVLFKRLSKGESFENPRAFLYRTANNMVLRVLDKSKKTVVPDVYLDDIETDIADSKINLESDIDYRELTRRLGDLLDNTEQEIFRLRFVEDMKIEEISKIMNMNPATCTTKIFRMRGRIKELLEKEGKL